MRNCPENRRFADRHVLRSGFGHHGRGGLIDSQRNNLVLRICDRQQSFDQAAAEAAASSIDHADAHSAQSLSGGSHRELPMLHAFDADQGIGNLLDLRPLALDDEDFEAVTVIQVHMHSRQHQRVESVLNGDELVGQQRHVMVIDKGDRPDRFFILIPFLPDQVAADEIAKRFRPVRVFFSSDMAIEIIEEMMIERHAEANEFLHVKQITRK